MLVYSLRLSHPPEADETANIISLGGVFITKLRFCNKNTSSKENYLAAITTEKL